jgi:hypothetical protein
MRNLKKILSGLLVGATLASSIVPAFAATNYTYEIQAKALYDLGLFKGVATEPGVYNPDLGASMDRETGVVMMLRLIGKIDDANAISDSEASTALAKYSDAINIDAWAKKAVAYAVEKGLVVGTTDSTVGPKEQFLGKMYAAIILRNVGYQITVANYDTSSSMMSEKGGLTAAEAVKFNDKDLIRDDMVGMSYGSLNLQYQATAKTIIETLVANGKVDKALAIQLGLIKEATQSVTATQTGSKQFTVAFNNAIDPTKATVTVKKGLNVVNVASVAASADNKSLVVSMPSKLTAGDYVVSVSGLSDTAISNTVTAADEQVSKIQFVGTQASYDRAGNTVLDAAVQVFNQFNEDVTSTYAPLLQVTSGNGTTSVPTTQGIFTITGATAYTLGSQVSVSALYTTTTSSAFANTVLTVSNQAQAASVTLNSLYNSSNKALTASNFASNDFYLIVDAKDQYGKSIVPTGASDSVTANNFFSDVIVNSTNSSVVGTPTSASIVTVDGVNKLALKLQAPASPIGGTATINVISKVTGSLTSYQVAVQEAAKVDTFTMTAPAVATARNTKIVIPFTAVDQFGNAVTDFNTIKNSVNVLSTLDTASSKAVSFQPDYVNNTATLVLDTTAMNAKGTVAITATTTNTTTSPTKVTTLNVNVTDSAVPSVIAGYTSDVKTNLLQQGGNQAIKNTYVNLLDQNGSALSLGSSWTGTNVFSTKDNKTYSYYFAVSSSDSSVAAITPDAGAIVVNGTSYVPVNTATIATVKAVKKGSVSVTMKLFETTDGATFTEVPNSANVTTFNVVDNADITAYAVAPVATLYENPDLYSAGSHAASVNVTGTLANGATVVIPAKQADGTKNYDTVVSSSYMGYSDGTNTTAGKVYSTGTGYAWGTATERTVTFVVTVYGANGPQVIVNTTKVSNVAPVAATVALRTNSDTAMYDNGALNGNLFLAGYKYIDANTISVNASNFNAADVNGSVSTIANTAVKVVDQYGKTMPTRTNATYAFSNVFVSGIKDASGSATNASGAAYTSADIAQGYSFSVTAITSNGMVITFRVVLK